MKRMSSLIILMVTTALVFSAQTSEVDQLKVDLVGQTMGGREKSWKFQSPDQIKELTIKGKVEEPQKRVYTIALQLQAEKGSGKYAAEARVEYTKAATGWKVKHVGLLSLKKIE
jgi:hypothetical protein